MADDTYSRGYRNDPAGRGNAAGPAVDPLTELARLIGQSDPFAPVDPRRPAPRPAEPSRQPADWQAEPPHHEQGYDRAHDHPQGHGHDQAHVDQAYDDQAPDAHYGADPRDYPPQYERQDHQAPADQGYYDDPHDTYPEQPYDGYRAEAPHDDGYAADPQGEHPDDLARYYDDEPPQPRRRGWMLTAAGLIGLAIVGAAAAVAYQKVFREGVPSIITRDPGPNKVIPSSQNADSRTNKRVDRIASGAPDERMVSREEQPVALPDTSRSASSFGQGGAPLTTPVQPSPPPADTGTVGAPDGGPAPRKIQTVRVPPDTTTPAAVAPRQAPARATAAQAPSQSGPMPIAQAPPPQQGGPLSLSPSPQPQVATAAPPPPRAAARAPAPPAAEAGGGYFVQVTAQRSEEEAQSSFRGIQAKYENLLGTQEPVIRRKDLGAKGIFFGAQVGPFSRESAVQLCENLKSAGASCMLQKN